MPAGQKALSAKSLSLEIRDQFLAGLTACLLTRLPRHPEFLFLAIRFHRHTSLKKREKLSKKGDHLSSQTCQLCASLNAQASFAYCKPCATAGCPAARENNTTVKTHPLHSAVTISARVTVTLVPSIAVKIVHSRGTPVLQTASFLLKSVIPAFLTAYRTATPYLSFLRIKNVVVNIV